MEEQSKQNQQRQNPTVIKAPIAAQDENFKHIIAVFFKGKYPVALG